MSTSYQPSSYIKLDDLNKKRRLLTAELEKSVIGQIEKIININNNIKPNAIVVSGNDFHEGIIGIVAGIVSLAGIWFTLNAEIDQLQLDIVRMQDNVELNHEFRVKWPRGEMGALPDDAKQDLKIHYLQKEVDYLRKVVKDLEIKQAKTE